jgi:hypothetical protein
MIDRENIQRFVADFDELDSNDPFVLRRARTEPET